MAGETENRSTVNGTIQAAEAAVREAVATHGKVHPVVLEQLERYIVCLRQAGKDAEVQKMEQHARALKQQLEAVQPAPAATAGGAHPAASAAAATPGAAPAATPVEPAGATPGATPEATPGITPGTPALDLYNSKGNHVAVAWDGFIFMPDGRNIGRWVPDLEAFLDRSGAYLGEIVEGNRLACHHDWPYKHMNFGDTGNTGDCAGWMHQPDTRSQLLPRNYDDFEFPE
jgi:hypothetical protein